MLCRLYVSREWIVSSTARRVYLIASIGTLALLGSLIAIAVAVAVTGQSLAEVNLATIAILYSILLIGVAGAATLRVAMFYYWYGFDHSGSGARCLWLLAMFLFGPVTALLYHFVIYRRRTAPDYPAARM